MNHRPPDPPDDDTTSAMLRALNDGSMAGLANFHLWRTQLLNVRSLPETTDSPGYHRPRGEH
jgi:hypothetical protein